MDWYCPVCYCSSWNLSCSLPREHRILLIWMKGKRGWWGTEWAACARCLHLPIPTWSTLYSTLLCPRRLTCVDYDSLVLGPPVRSGNGGTLLQRSAGGRRRWMGYLFLWFSPCRDTLGSYVHQANITGPLQLALSTQLSAFRFCKPFFSIFLCAQE